jgi:hypothetical protein
MLQKSLLPVGREKFQFLDFENYRFAKVHILEMKGNILFINR